MLVVSETKSINELVRILSILANPRPFQMDIEVLASVQCSEVSANILHHWLGSFPLVDVPKSFLFISSLTLHSLQLLYQSSIK